MKNIIALLLLIPFLANAQEQKLTTKDGKKIIYNPDGTWRYEEKPSSKGGFSQLYKSTLSADIKPGFADSYLISDYSDFFKVRLSMSYGLEFKVLISKKKLFLNTGVYYSDKGYRADTEVSDNSGNSLGEQTWKIKNKYLTIPINLVFQHKGFYVGGGINGDYFLQSVFAIKDSTKKKSTDKTYQSEILLGSQFLIGYEVPISKVLLLGFGGYAELTFPIKDKFPERQTDEEKYINYGLSCRLIFILGSSTQLD